MKKHSVKLAGLVLFFAAGVVIGMERLPHLIVRNEARGYLVNWNIKVSINNSSNWVPEGEVGLEVGKQIILGDLYGINQIEIRRSGAGTKTFGYLPLNITQQELNDIKQESADHIGEDVTLVIGLTNIGWFNLSTHYWTKPPMQEKPESELPGHIKTIMHFSFSSKGASITDKDTDIITEILKRDISKDKRFEKRLAEQVQLYKDDMITLQEFESNINKILRELKRFRTLSLK